MKKIVSVVSAAVMLLIMTASVAALPAPSAGGDVGSALPVDYDVPCDFEWSLNTIDGDVITSESSAGKIRVMIFFNSDGTCGNSNFTIMQLANCDWIMNDGIEVLAIGTVNSGDDSETVKQMVVDYKARYAPDDTRIKFCYLTNRDFFMNFVFPFNEIEPNFVMGRFAINVVIDSNDHLRYNWTGSYNADYYAAVLSLIDSGISGNPELFRIYNVRITGECDYDAAYEVLELLNQYRLSQGLNALTMDRELLDIAMYRVAETAIYWSHDRPNASSFATVAYKATSENIAVGFPNPEWVMTGWRNSPGHNANMLKNAHASVGIGCFIDESGVFYWNQVFSFDAGTEETVRRSGRKEQTFDIEAAAGFLDLSLDRSSVSVGEGGTETVELKNRNIAWNTDNTVIDSTFAESDDPGIATVKIENGRAVITGVKTGVTKVRIGLSPVGDYPPYTLEAEVVVKPPYLPGDLNTSGGEPDVSDGIVMQRILAGLEPEIPAADLNGSGDITVADGVIMQRILAGLE